jgi:TorA maturation chaperone TorD
LELFRALAVLAEPPRDEHAPLRAALGFTQEPDAAAHTDLFVFELVPYASVYLDADGMLGGEARDRVAGFWRALKIAPPPEPDALVALLGLYAHLDETARGEGDAARRALIVRARDALLWEHLAPWAFAYAAKAREVAAGFYRGWAGLLYDALGAAASACDPSQGLPVALRAAPAGIEPGGDAETFLTGLLSPVRSGMLLTRADLRAAAAELGLGLRQGERRYALRALLGQDADATLGWLEREAVAWAARHEALEACPAAIRGLWAARARAAAGEIARVRAEALTPP